MTPQRRVILEEVRGTRSHPAAHEVYEMVRRRLPKISLGTVYRNLEILSELGVIRRMDLGDGQCHYDGDLDNHYHVRCTKCGRITDLFMDPICDLESTIKRQTGFEIIGHRLDFFGLCPVCRRLKESGPAVHLPVRDSEKSMKTGGEDHEGGSEGGRP
jgi:Fur family ferric uptake transcriptional regulator